MNDSDISKAILEQLENVKSELIERYLNEKKNKIREIPVDTIKAMTSISGEELPNNASIEKAFMIENDLYLTVKLSMR